MFVTKCQCRMDTGKHNPSKGVASHVPSCTADMVSLYRTILQEMFRSSLLESQSRTPQHLAASPGKPMA